MFPFAILTTCLFCLIRTADGQQSNDDVSAFQLFSVIFELLILGSCVGGNTGSPGKRGNCSLCFFICSKSVNRRRTWVKNLCKHRRHFTGYLAITTDPWKNITSEISWTYSPRLVFPQPASTSLCLASGQIHNETNRRFRYEIGSPPPRPTIVAVCRGESQGILAKPFGQESSLNSP